MSDADVARAVHALLCGAISTTDLYKGDCLGCGECCSRFLPLSTYDLRRLKPYVLEHGIKPHEPRGEVDLMCPWLTDGKECAVYAARPEVCRAYRCDLDKRGEIRPFFGAASAKITDMRELAEGWGDAGQGD